jgi:hypothetical protein
MAGFDNDVTYSIGTRLEPSTAQAIALMKKTPNDISYINTNTDPEGAVSANPGSYSHDPFSGIVYFKFTGTGNTGWYPIFQSLPQKLFTIYDDFTNLSLLNWDTGGENVIISSENGHPGIVKTGYSEQFNGFYYSANFLSSIKCILLGSGKLSVNFVVNLNTLSTNPNEYQAYFGLTDEMILADPQEPANGVWFYYTDSVNSGQWVLNCSSGGTTTSVNTTVAASTNWVNLGFIVNADADEVNFTINGTPVGTPITTNIPTVAMAPFMNWTLAGTDPESKIDLFMLNYLLTTTR